MKIRRQKTVTEMVEIGEFDFIDSLPTKPRLDYGLPCKCAACGENITDERFIVAIKKGHPNMMLHAACCPQWQAKQALALAREETGR